MSRLTRLSIAAAAALPLSIGAIAFGAANVAGAAPVNAPTSLHGTFTCDTGMTGTFVTNTGNATATPANVAHLMSSTGARGIFVPSTLTFAIVVVTTTTGAVIGTFSETTVKGNGHAPSPDSCTISATIGPFMTPGTGSDVTATLTGTVVGKIVWNG